MDNLHYILYIKYNVMGKRLNKEYKLDVSNKIAMKYGSVNREDPKVVYVNGKCWVTPLRKMDYSSVISLAKDNMRKDIKKLFIDGVNFDGKFIFDFDICLDKMEPSVKKFLTFDLFARQVKGSKKTLKDLRRVMEGNMRLIANNLAHTLSENNFSVTQRKEG